MIKCATEAAYAANVVLHTCKSPFLLHLINSGYMTIFCLRETQKLQHTIGTTGPEAIYFTSFGKKGLSFNSA